MPPKKVSKQSKTIEQQYQKKSQREHILLRPDSYVGSVSLQEEKMWVYDKKTDSIVEKHITYPPGLYKIFDEIAVNAADHGKNHDSCNKFDFEFNTEENRITVKNNGPGIAVVEHLEHKIWIPTLIFGHLLTGSNFDDDNDTERVTGGRNGYGAKLTNIYSTEFIIETVDAERGKKFHQVFRDNMTVEEKPKITTLKSDKPVPYTKISFVPDLAKFGLKKLTPDIISLFIKRAYDLAGVCKGCSVTVDGEKIKFPGFKSYIDKFKFTAEHEGETDIQTTFSSVVYADTERWQVGAVFAPDQNYKHVSYVNSICTYQGGTHVVHVTDLIVDKIRAAINKKVKKLVVKPQTIKDNLILFVNSTIVQPAFMSQVKESLKTPIKSFGSKCELPAKFYKSLCDTGIVDHIISNIQNKDQNKISKKSTKSKGNLSDIIKYENCKYAGTSKSLLCSLILTEGDSAKALAIAGLSEVDKDYYAVLPLKGKPMNVREHSAAAIAKNEEICNIVRIMGLRIGKLYKTDKDRNDLRLGRIMIMTDQDTDGFHIKGLLMNLFHYFWPSLLEIPGFITAFQTPVLKAFKGKSQLQFFNMIDYFKWKESNNENWKIKYYKGLGTSSKAEAKEYFRNLDEMLRSYYTPVEENAEVIDKEDNIIMKAKPVKAKKVVAKVDDEEEEEEDDGIDINNITEVTSKYKNKTTEAITLAFEKTRANDRKIWVKNCSNNVLDYSKESVSIPDFINREMILFSVDDCERSVASLDGLKISQRKILYTVMLKKIFTESKELRVSELASLVTGVTSYHHGEASLIGAIIKMAQDYVGSNNLNLLVPAGQYGSRALGGKDAASPRYINTYLESIAQLLFKNVDNNVLDFLDDNGKIIEPKLFAPILPLVLINGTEGIGTGFSSSVPKFDVKDLIMIIRALLNGEIPDYDIMPSFRGFTGTILRSNTPGMFLSYGKYQIIDETDNVTIQITELPLGSNTAKTLEGYKIFLDSMVSKKKIISFTSDIVAEPAVFTVTMEESVMDVLKKKKEIYKTFKLKTNINTTNMYLYNAKGEIKKYHNIKEIINDFYDMRLEVYVKRKKFLIGKYEKEISKLEWKMKFINDVIEENIIVFKQKKATIIARLEELEYPKFMPDKKLVKSDLDDDDDDDEDSDVGNYDYLTSIKLFSLTYEKIAELQKLLDLKNEEFSVIKNTSEEQQWLKEIDEFEVEYDEWIAREPVIYETTNIGGKKKTSKKTTKKVTKKTTKKVIKKMK